MLLTEISTEEFSRLNRDGQLLDTARIILKNGKEFHERDTISSLMLILGVNNEEKNDTSVLADSHSTNLDDVLPFR